MARSNDDRRAAQGPNAERQIVDPQPTSDRVTIWEVAGIFRFKAIENAVEALMLSGIDRADIDLIGDIKTLERRLGGIIASAEELADLPRVPRRLSNADSAVALSVALASVLLFQALWRLGS